MTAEATTPAEGARPARDSDLPSLRPGWITVAGKEFADHLLSVRFYVLLIVLGIAALILWLFARYRDSALAGYIAAVGRAALSNYLGSSIVMCAVFYGWGLGLFGHLRASQLPLLLLGAWPVMLLWSTLWLRRFAVGPMEWLWRSLARIQPRKIRKSN